MNDQKIERRDEQGIGMLLAKSIEIYFPPKISVVMPQNLKAFKTFLTLKLRQYGLSGYSVLATFLNLAGCCPQRLLPTHICALGREKKETTIDGQPFQISNQGISCITCTSINIRFQQNR